MSIFPDSVPVTGVEEMDESIEEVNAEIPASAALVADCSTRFISVSSPIPRAKPSVTNRPICFVTLEGDAIARCVFMLLTAICDRPRAAAATDAAWLEMPLAYPDPVWTPAEYAPLFASSNALMVSAI
jgi:hypothetical protein